MILSLGLVFIVVLLTGFSQLLLKMGSQTKKDPKNFFAVYLNSYTISAYIIFLIVTVISVIALREIPLKLFYAITSLNFVIVALLSSKFLSEKISKEMLLGIILIALGVVIFNV